MIITLWIIGILFTFGFSMAEEDVPWWAPFVVLLAWPLVLGFALNCWLQDRTS